MSTSRFKSFSRRVRRSAAVDDDLATEVACPFAGRGHGPGELPRREALRRRRLIAASVCRLIAGTDLPVGDVSFRGDGCPPGLPPPRVSFPS